jgi:hypothetical protein
MALGATLARSRPTTHPIIVLIATSLGVLIAQVDTSVAGIIKSHALLGGLHQVYRSRHSSGLMFGTRLLYARMLPISLQREIAV